MVRWIEGKDAYLLRVSKAEEVALFVALALTFVGVGAWGILHEPGLLLHICFGGPVVGGCLVLLFIAYMRWEYSAWVEVPLKGGPIRWGTHLEGDSAPLEVKAFEVEVVGEWGVFTRPHHHVVAVTARGDRVRVLGLWETVDQIRAQRIVSQLNEVLVPRRAEDGP